jgi:C4-dicarboxylate transporter DctM subunit
MDPTYVGILGIAVMLVMLLSGVPIPAVLALVGIFGIASITGWKAALSLAGTAPFEIAADYQFAALVLFVCMGVILHESGLTETLFDAASKWLSKFTGGMLMATSLAGGFFGACSGSSVASCAMFARIAVPQLVQLGYDRSFSCGCVATAGTLAALIPPSGLLILYGILTEESIGRLFIGGLLPGIINIILYGVIIYGAVVLKPGLAPKGVSFSWSERFTSLKEVWPVPLIGVAVIASIYFGIATPTEIAGLGAFFSLIVSVSFVGIKQARVFQALLETARQGCMVLLIVVGAMVFSKFLALSQLPTAMVSGIESLNIPNAMVMLVLAIIYVIMGSFVSTIAMILVTTPVVFPLVVGLGYDPIWWGVVLVQLAEIGCLTPPVGINVYVTKTVVGDSVTLPEVFKGTLIFAIADFALLAFIMLFPQIVLFLPGTM